MSHIKSRKHPSAPQNRLITPAVAALATGLTLPAYAQTAQREVQLPAVNVTAPGEVPYKAETSASPKFTQPLIDTPKTVQIIKKEVLQEQGASTLMEALRNTPGITMQLGENGNTSAGDAFQMRGFSTQQSTFLDGIRDLGAVTRDVFNLEQVEVVKGAAGSDIGRGAASGYINLISKLPYASTFSQGNLTLGSADKKRFTADLNQALNGSTGFRLNVMAQDSGVPGRDRVKNSGVGIAPSIGFGLGTPTRVYVYSQHLRQNNVPDGGISTIGMDGFYNANAAVRNGSKVRRENFYGSTNDYEKVEADMVTLQFEHDFSASTTIRNIARYGKNHMDRVLTGVNNITAVTADPATWTLSRSRQRVDQTNEIFGNQTTLTTSFQTGTVKHDLVGGVEILKESQLTLGTAAGGAVPAANLYNPNPNDPMGTPILNGANTNGETTTIAAFVYDTLTLNESWKLNGGMRFEHYNTDSTARTAAGTATTLSDSDNLRSWNVGAVYKLAPNGSLYAGYANSLTPPGSANFTLSAAAGNINNASLDPQETSNIEVGTKWDLLNKRLNVTAALFRTENDKQTTTDPVTLQVVQEGKTRVRGIELAAVGQITNFWQIAAGLQKTRTTQANVQNAAGVITDAVRWSPDTTATLWTSYQWGAFTLGGGARYVSEQKRTITNTTAAQNMPSMPAYTVADLMAAYKLTKDINLQLNIYNLFDKEYIATLNNGGSRVRLGEPRSLALTASMKF